MVARRRGSARSTGRPERLGLAWGLGLGLGLGSGLGSGLHTRGVWPGPKASAQGRAPWPWTAATGPAPWLPGGTVTVGAVGYGASGRQVAAARSIGVGDIGPDAPARLPAPVVALSPTAVPPAVAASASLASAPVTRCSIAAACSGP